MFFSFSECDVVFAKNKTSKSWNETMYDACTILNHCGLWSIDEQKSSPLHFLDVKYTYVVPMSIRQSSSNMPSFHYGHFLAVLSKEIQLLSCVETSLQYILYIGQQSPLVCFVGWPKKKCIYAKNRLTKWNIRRNSTSVQISHAMKEKLVSWHKNVLWQLRIRIWEMSLTLWNKSKCVTCDFVKLS